MQLVIIEINARLAFWSVIIVNVDDPEKQIAEIIIGLLAVLYSHGIQAVDKNCKIVVVEFDFHG